MNKIPLLFSGGETQPSDLSGLKLWLDASTLTGSDGSAVASWTDRSANQANFSQQTTAAQPTLQTNELNGKNVVRFDGVDDFMNLTAPLDVQPTAVSSNNACSWSRNGSYLFHCNTSTSPYHFLYKVTGDQFNKMVDLSPLTSITSINASAWSANDTYLALACSSATQRLLIFKRTGDTFTRLTDPVSPNGNITAVDWYFDGSNHYLACSGAGDRLFLYKNSGDTFNQLTAPATLPVGTSNYCAFSPDGSRLFVSASGAPFITFYSRSGDTFTKLNDPTTALAVSSLGSDWVDNDNIVVGLSGSVPRLYTWDGTTFQQGSAVGAYAAANNSKFDSTKAYLAIATSTTPFFRVYSRSGTTYTLLNTPSSLPTSTGRGVAWSPDSNYLAVSHTNAPFLQIYKRNGNVLTNLAKLNMLRNVSGASVFVVRKCNSFVATSINVSVTTASSGGIRLYSAQLSTSKVRTSAKRLDADTTVSLDATTSSSTTNFEILGQIVDYTNADAFLYLNGVLDASSTSFGTAGNTQDTDSAVVTVGSFTGSSYLNGDIAEVIIYDRTLTPNEISQVHDYLQNKYYIYSPKEISGLQLWLDASTINQADGTAVASWSDLSGNAYDAAQATTASQPTYKTNIQNGLGVVRFDGVDDFLSLSTGLGMFNSVPGATVIVVGRYAFDSTSDISFSASVGISSSYRIAMFTTSSNKFQFAVRQTDVGGASAPFSTQTGTPFTGAIHAGVVNYSSTQRFVYVNNALGGSASGAPFTSGTTSATDSTYIYVGKYGAAGYELNGDICEIVVYNRALEANEFRQLHQYLGRKWGITIA